MQHYTKRVEKYNDTVTDDSESAVNRYAQRISRLTGLPVMHVRNVLLANAAVREH